VSAAAAAAARTTAALARRLRAFGAVPDGLHRVINSPGATVGRWTSVPAACAPIATGHAAATAAAAIA